MKKFLVLCLFPGFLILLLSCSRDHKSSNRSVNSNEGVASSAKTRKSSTHPGSPTNELAGIVISITDGDTIILLDDNDALHEIRLKGIDAPEHRRRQAFEKESRVHLARLIAGKQITVQ